MVGLGLSLRLIVTLSHETRLIKPPSHLLKVPEPVRQWLGTLAVRVESQLDWPGACWGDWWSTLLRVSGWVCVWSLALSSLLLLPCSACWQP